MFAGKLPFKTQMGLQIGNLQKKYIIGVLVVRSILVYLSIIYLLILGHVTHELKPS